jgi:hypothetical protein
MPEDIHRIDRTGFDPIRIKPNYEQPGNPSRRREPGKKEHNTHLDQGNPGFDLPGDETAEKHHSLDIEA